MTGRLFWFFVGGAAATWWTGRRQNQIECAAPIQPSLSSDGGIPPTIQSQRGFWRFGSPSRSSGEKPYAWEEEQAKMQALTRQAGDAMTDLSEATLDSLLSTVQTLKAKLADHRAQRELQQRAFAEQLEVQRVKQPPQYD